MKKISNNSLSALQPFRNYFDNSKINTETVSVTNDFILRCLNEDGPPLCVREAISKSNSDFRSFRSSHEYINKFAIDDIFLVNLSADIIDRNSKEKALLEVECVMDADFRKTVLERFGKKKSDRFDALCQNFQIDKKAISDVPYSLVERFYSFFEYATYRNCEKSDSVSVYDYMIFAIHSFGKNSEGFDSFKKLSESMGMKIAKANTFSSPKEIIYYDMDGYKQHIQAQLLWVDDKTFAGLDC